MSEPRPTVTITCAWKECAVTWDGRWELMPNEWGWPHRAAIGFMKQHGLIGQEIDYPYLCPVHTTNSSTSGKEKGEGRGNDANLRRQTRNLHLP